MGRFVADAIFLGHMCFVAFIVVVPFLKISSWLLLTLHFVAVLNLVVHWYLNSDVCALTVLESSVRGIPMDQSFMHRIVSPIYDFDGAGLDGFVWFATIALGVVSGLRLYSERRTVMRELPMIKMLLLTSRR